MGQAADWVAQIAAGRLRRRREHAGVLFENPFVFCLCCLSLCSRIIYRID